MPNVNFYIKDKLYTEYVNLPAETKKALKKQWRDSISKGVKNAPRAKAVV